MLIKDYGINAAKTEEHRNELVRDAFIKGIASQSSRQELPETTKLTVLEVLDKARSI